MNKQIFRKVISFLFILFVLLTMFLLSGQDSYQSYSLSFEVRKYLCTKFPIFVKLFAIFNIRKVGHFFIFMILGISVYLFVIQYTKQFASMISLVICMFFAGLDEFHQFFVPGRALAFKDMVIDTLGSLTSIFIISFFVELYDVVHKPKEKNISNKKGEFK